MSAWRIGSRGSQLALWQARAVAQLLESRGEQVEVVVIKTSGDRLQQASLAEIGGKRLFVKEIEDALLGREVDIAVHSAKDMPALIPEGLSIAAALPREDPLDALVLPAGKPVADLAAAVAAIGDTPTIGTSSVRRIAQLATVMPRAQFLPIRGNVDTRLAKLDAGGFDALVLAAAGLRRLGFLARISAAIPAADCLPAPGQGIVAIETREDDHVLRRVLAGVNDVRSSQALDAERALVAALGGGCQLPVGALAVHDGDEIQMHAIVTSLDGRRSVRRSARGPAGDAAVVGHLLAAALARAGATEILDEVRGSQGPVEGSY
jgi:hydroxymethylbilane synthase